MKILFKELILNIFKPPALTSFDVIRAVRKEGAIKKAGHAGSLDPFATGVLLVCLGDSTKKISELMELKKEYEGVMEFGTITDTYDAYGKIKEIKPVKRYSPDLLERLFSKFIGKIMQIPPMYSAVKYSGVPLYKIARAGREVERKPKEVKIYSLKILKYESPFLTFKITCSKGTYIRSLAYDIGQRLGCGSYLKSLTRTKVGKYSIRDSLFLGDLGSYFNSQKFYGSCK